MDATTGQAAGFTLKRHSLTARNKNCDFLTVISYICGLNSQSARAPYLSLWARVKDFKRSQYEDALYKNKRLIKTWLLRGTVHTVPAGEYPVYLKALESYQLSRRERGERDLEKMGLELAPGLRQKLAGKVVELLSQDSLTIAEIQAKTEDILKSVPEKGRRWRIKQSIMILSNKGIVCHAEPTGPWYHFKENRFTTVEKWYKGRSIAKIDEWEARSKLALKYFYGYGPATVADFCYWSGLKTGQCKQAFEAIKHNLTEVKVDGKSLWLLTQDADILADIPKSPDSPVRFLPEFDSLVMGHKDKTRLLAEEHRPKVFLKLADVAPVFLSGGRIAGTWKHKISDKSFELEPFARLGKEEQQTIDNEFERLREFVEGN